MKKLFIHMINVLKIRELIRLAAVAAAALCSLTLAACAVNPPLDATHGEQNSIAGNYVFEKQVYINPLSSFTASNGFTEYYTFTDNRLVISGALGFKQKFDVTYEYSEIDKKAFKQAFIMELGMPDLPRYRSGSQWDLKDASGGVMFRVLLMDEEIWLVRMHRDTANASKSEYIWSIYKLAPYGGDIPASAEIYGTKADVSKFLELNQEFDTPYEQDECFNITPYDISENSGYRIFKYSESCASFLLYEGKIYALDEWFGGLGVTSLAIDDIDGDKLPELYFTYSWGSGMHRAHAGYFDPVSKQVVHFDHVQFNQELLIAYNDTGGISLYKASIAHMNSFVDLSVESTGLVSDIVFEDGRITLKLHNN